MNNSQTDLILDYLQRGNEITPINALEYFGCFRLSSVIFKLKARGHNIKTSLVDNPNGKKYASYKLIPKERLF